MEMKEITKPSPQKSDAHPSIAQRKKLVEARKKRLAEALRKNLQKRKEQKSRRAENSVAELQKSERKIN
ncbi:MAG: hypothetical protein BGO67_00960 [Alphaproteobacteria bacterium 41-28]|nr:MAG: hypothetical protein BGO67_00960 [Alphaproteobacteria bacterium 41-28]